MKYAEFGKTGLTVSEVGFGGIPIIRLDVATAVKVLRRAFDRGITFYDTANMYRDSEEKIGRAFAGEREKIVIATKTIRRDAKGAIRQMENSLRALGTDYIDIYQLHHVTRENDLAAASGPDGAMEALAKAREEGKIRYLGVTSHSIPMAEKLVRTGLFMSIQFPFNFIETSAADGLIDLAKDAGMGILGMKPFAGGMIDNAGIAIKYLRQYPDVLTIPGFDSVESVDQIVAFYEKPNVVSGEDRRLMERYRIELGKAFCRRCEYCMPCPAGVMITPAMAYKVVASRMSPAVSVEFARPAMESISLCTACGECEERCPYGLPIQEMLKASYDLFERHRADLAGC